jgi:GWxTD domain-containing protein
MRTTRSKRIPARPTRRRHAPLGGAAGRAVLVFLALTFFPDGPGVLARQSEGPAETSSKIGRADTLLAHGDVEGAYHLLRRILKEDPKSVPALVSMGLVMLANRAGGSRAVDYLTRAVRLEPDNIEARFQKALAHLRLAPGDAGRDNARQARIDLERIIALNPSHPDAWYRLGLLRQTYYSDVGGAADAFLKQLETYPAHAAARQQLLESHMAAGDWRGAARSGELILERAPDVLEAYPYVAAAHWKLGENERAMEVFESYLERLDGHERSLYLDLDSVLSVEEAAEYAALDEEGRRYYREHYWSVRNPDVTSPVNERLLEHYARVAYSRLEFGRVVWPWDERGEMYVRYGEPDRRIGFGRPYAEELIDQDPEFVSRRREFEQEVGMPLNELGEREEGGRARAQRQPERWIYLDKGLDLTFEDPVSSGRFSIHGAHTRLLVERLEENLPSLSLEEDRIGRLEPLQSLVTFRGQEGMTRLEYAYALLPEDFGAFRSSTGAYAELDVDIQLYSPGWIPVVGATEPARRIETVPQMRIRGVPLFVDATRVQARPGRYLLSTRLMDPATGNRVAVKGAIELPDYSGSELMLSDILPAVAVQEVARGRTGRFVHGEVEVLPLPGSTIYRDQSLFIYYEIYNLTKDAYGATDYVIEYSVVEAPEEEGLTRMLWRGIRNLIRPVSGLAGLSSRIEQNGIRNEVPSWLEIDMKLAPPGTYELQLVVTDRLTGRTASNTLRFRSVPRL